MRTWTAWAGLLCVLVLPGCSKLANKLVEKAQEEAQKQAATTETSQAEEVDKDGELADKLSNYISCLNGATRNVFDSRNRYLEWIKDEKVGPTGKERIVYAPQEIFQADTCVKDLEKAKGMKPPLAEIEAAAVTYQTALEKVKAEVKTAHGYYSQQDYKDDKFAKAKAMHPTLMAAYEGFKAANEPFEAKVVALNEEVGKRQLEKISKDPDRSLEFRQRTVVNAAKALVKSAEVKTLAELDQASYDANLEAYSKAVTELDDYATKNAAEASKVTLFSSFVSATKELLKAAKELSRRKRDNKDFSKERAMFAHTVEGHPAQVIDKFNNLVRQSNSLRYDSLYRDKAQARAKQASAQ